MKALRCGVYRIIALKRIATEPSVGYLTILEGARCHVPQHLPTLDRGRELIALTDGAFNLGVAYAVVRA